MNEWVVELVVGVTRSRDRPGGGGKSVLPREMGESIGLDIVFPPFICIRAMGESRELEEVGGADEGCPRSIPSAKEVVESLVVEAPGRSFRVTGGCVAVDLKRESPRCGRYCS